MGQGKRLMDVIATGVDLPTEAPLRMPLIELAGYRRILIENHKGVVQYSETCIQIKVCYGRICVQGNGLSLTHMTRSQLVITGCVDSIGISREKRK